MSEHLGKKAYSEEETEGRNAVLTLTTAGRMLPLIRQIVGDLLTFRQGLSKLQPEEDRLQRIRRTLTWPERERRYAIQEELAKLDREFKEALAEMEGLGVALLDPEQGRVGFPTKVNGKKAFFSWRPGEDGLHHWQFAEGGGLYTIPASWFTQGDLHLTNKG